MASFGPDGIRDPWNRFRFGLALITAVLVGGTIGYVLLDLTLLEALYQTVITVTTVGYGEIGPVSDEYRVFTIILLLTGTGTVFYTLGVLLETLVEGRLNESFRRRRVARNIQELDGHTVVCGYGQVGRAIAAELVRDGTEVVIVDRDPDMDADDGMLVHGNATDDDVLLQAGIERAAALVVAMDTDADNVYVTLSARSMRKDLFIVARASDEHAEPKLYQAGADRVVNPHRIGGTRMAAMVMQPTVADFLDMVMHDRELSVRIEELPVDARSPFRRKTLRQCRIRERTGATVLALRTSTGDLNHNPQPDSRLDAGDVVIALGTEEQLRLLFELNTSG
ncbi:MAG: potassium channel protein [Actinomycetota bacterium]|nr:potassium channel protein [Actinomycetota bacterium]